jgi:predicted amidohydrolase
MKSVLRVAGCQFAIDGDVDYNLAQILAQVREAAQRGARIVHFPEAALCGYPGIDMPDFSRLDWNMLHRATEAVCMAAAEWKVWVLLGSAHRLSGNHRPHNSVYVISDQGKVVERYDKRFCTGTRVGDPGMDLTNYTPGNHTAVFTVDGYTCSSLICYDYRFPELYRDLKRHGVELLFQSFHNARYGEELIAERQIQKEIVPATIMCHAATNHLWISATNSTAKHSMWASFFTRPDGKITGRLEVHTPGVLISEVNPEPKLWDAAGPWRDRAMQGCLYSGELVEDPRSQDRTCY